MEATVLIRMAFVTLATVSTARAADTDAPTKLKGYYPDITMPLFLDQGTLICREKIALEVALQKGSGAVSRADTATCINMPHTSRVTVLGYSESSLTMAHVRIEDPPNGTDQGWTALRWLDDRADCEPGRIGCD
jgi:hypothetical protein